MCAKSVPIVAKNPATSRNPSAHIAHLLAIIITLLMVSNPVYCAFAMAVCMHFKATGMCLWVYIPQKTSHIGHSPSEESLYHYSSHWCIIPSLEWTSLHLPQYMIILHTLSAGVLLVSLCSQQDSPGFTHSTTKRVISPQSTPYPCSNLHQYQYLQVQKQ